jgi:hypothetical protein
MTNERIHAITKYSAIVMLVLVLLPCSGAGEDTPVGAGIGPEPCGTHPITGEPLKYKGDYVEAKRVRINKAAGDGQEWIAIAYQVHEGQTGFTQDNECPSKLCFTGENGKPAQACFEPIVTSDKGFWICQYVEELSLVPVSKDKDSGSDVLFVAYFLSGSPYVLRLITLWSYDEKRTRFVNILPEITISELGEFKLFPEEELTPGRTLIVANCMWGKDETRHDPHYYGIRIYQEYRMVKSFKMIAEYVTKEKYHALDDADKVINPEMKNIKKAIEIK